MNKNQNKPTLLSASCVCPRCGAFAGQAWYFVHDVHGALEASRIHRSWDDVDISNELESSDFVFSRCKSCDGFAFWFTGTNGDGFSLEHPLPRHVGPDPNADMEVAPEVEQLYGEAREIAGRSPRAAAALLRLALQHLCLHLGAPENKTLNDQIGHLFELGLPVSIQRAMDVIRVYGNESVHPGEINLDDDKSAVEVLFRLLNVITEQLITLPRKTDEMIQQIPAGKRQQIENR